MSPGDRRAGAYTVFVVALWAVVFPAVLVRDQTVGVGAIPWRNVLFLSGSAALLIAGTALVFFPGRSLARQGIAMLGTKPGSHLVTDGWHGTIRNPMDVGTTLLSLAAYAAFDVDIMWVVPAAALLYYTVGVGLYEDRRLLEEFEDDFPAYRRSVPKWVPRRRGG